MRVLFLLLFGISSFWSLPRCHADVLVGFEELSLSQNSFYNGADAAGGWTSGGVFFNNSYNPNWGSWSGFAYSNVVDKTTSGFGNQYAAFASANPGAGANGSSNYAVAFGGANSFFNMPESSRLISMSVTNTTYTALSMRDGDSFSKQFGGLTGNDPDWFRVTFTGFSDVNATGSTTGSVDFYLADFRFADNSLDYIIDEWTNLSLTSLGIVRSVRLSFSSSDVGAWGMNTPAYVALDNLRFAAVPEPSSLALIAVAGSLWVWRRRKMRYTESPR
ncbi:DUF4465 domain-containing protein [Pirellulaceae bacterium SH449]